MNSSSNLVSDQQPLKDYSSNINNVPASYKSEFVFGLASGGNTEIKSLKRTDDDNNQVIVSGKFTYYDSEASVDKPVRYARVELWDFDQYGGNDFLATSYTDLEGKFVFNPLINVDFDEFNSKLDFFIVVYADSTPSVVLDSEQVVWSSFTNTYSETQNGEVYLGVFEVGNPIPFKIMDIILDGHRFILNEGYKLKKVRVVYPSSLFGYTPYFETIYAGEAWGADLGYYLLHEYGHHVSSQVSYYRPELFLGINPNPDHTLLTYEDPIVAFEEGWALFFMAVVESEYDYPKGYLFGEMLDCFSSYLPYLDENNIDHLGWAVAATLWDIYDDKECSGADGDNLHLGSDEIFDVFLNLDSELTVGDDGENVHTIYKFWDVWNERSHGNKEDLARILTLNGLGKVHNLDLDCPQSGSGSGSQSSEPEPECRLISTDGEWYGKNSEIIANFSGIDNISYVKYFISADNNYEFQVHNFEDGLAKFDGWIISSKGEAMVSVKAVLENFTTVQCLTSSGEDVIQVSLDYGGPTGTIKIENGEDITDNLEVNLKLTFSDEISGVDSCRYSNDGQSWSQWAECTETKSWTLSEGKGTKSVYYQIIDAAGNIYECSDNIEFKPVITVCSDGCDYGIISEAINNADEKDTIVVKGGTYNEELVIDKQITLKGEEIDGEMPVIFGADSAVTIEASGVDLGHFAVKSDGIGIFVLSDNNRIHGNKVFDNKIGILVQNVEDNEISSNDVFENDIFGIIVYLAENNRLWSNDIYKNGYYGLYLYHSDYNAITGSEISKNNHYGVILDNSDGNEFLFDSVFQHRIDILLYRSYDNEFVSTSGTIIRI